MGEPSVRYEVVDSEGEILNFVVHTIKIKNVYITLNCYIIYAECCSVKLFHQNSGVIVHMKTNYMIAIHLCKRKYRVLTLSRILVMEMF